MGGVGFGGAPFRALACILRPAFRGLAAKGAGAALLRGADAFACTTRRGAWGMAAVSAAICIVGVWVEAIKVKCGESGLLWSQNYGLKRSRQHARLKRRG